MKYKILLKQSNEGSSVSCPGLPGCWSQGKTEEEAITNISEAIQDYLQAIVSSYENENIREVVIAV
jgi:predicted RNase H-like HicB family nuclease